MNRITIGFLLLLTAIPVLSLEIVITQGNDKASKIAVVPFGTPDGVKDMAPIVEFDLHRSGQFAPIAEEDMLSLPQTPNEVNFRDWRVLGTDYVVIGQVEKEEDTLTVTFYAFDVSLERKLFSGKVTGLSSQHRAIAHMVADKVFESITDIPGAFSTKVMYVLVEGRGTETPSWRLEVADSDGQNAQRVLESLYPIMSPTWAPDGETVAYVSFESGRSNIIVHEIYTGKRDVVAAFEGTNSSPEFSPDGKHLAMSLSRDGNPEIYVMEVASRKFKRITTHRAIDTEPVWSLDGKEIVFTSDRSGNPQIYRINVETLKSKRLSFQGDYNARPRILPDGEHMLFVHRINRTYHIVWSPLDNSGNNIVLTKNVLDESPSVAPNGSMIIFATKEESKGTLGIVSVDGQVEFRLPSSEGDVQEPAWSPFLSTTLTFQQL
ncbi:MAG: Tol-Pal system beta propeller repeat protein TolB [Gammaproteobacteria bacterium]|nr:Tol-Pal system beta propeller repeat protein TolB [Gammaproteobacteria bacterium]